MVVLCYELEKNPIINNEQHNDAAKSTMDHMMTEL